MGGFVVEDLGRQGMRAPGQLRRPEQLFTLNLRYFTELHSGREDHRVAPPSGFPRERAGPRVTFGGPWWTLVNPGVILGSFSRFVSKWYCKESVSLFHSETKEDHAISRMVVVAMVFQQLLI